MTYLAIALSVLAFAFTVLSFWWLHARRGHLECAAPASYAFDSSVRLRLPLALFNTGATALIVTDMHVVADGADGRRQFGWITTRKTLRPETDDGHAFSTPFAIPGRATREVIAEFGEASKWEPSPGSRHHMSLHARIHPAAAWQELTAFDWWAPPEGAQLHLYIAYENKPSASAATG